MNDERMGQIALAVLKARMLKEGVNLSANLPRELGSLAQQTGISKEELHEFTVAILPEIIGSALGFDKVSITTGNRVPEKRSTHEH